MFEAHRHTDFYSLAESSASREVGTFSSASKDILISAAAEYAQLLGASKQVEGKEYSGNHVSQGSSQGCAHHAHIGAPDTKFESAHVIVVSREYQEPVEQDIHGAHDDASHARDLHIAATTQHTTRQLVHLGGGQCGRIDEEIGSSVAAYLLCAAQPYGEEGADSHATYRHDADEQEARYESLSHDEASILEAFSPYFLSHLHGKARSSCHTKATYEPCSASHKAY